LNKPFNDFSSCCNVALKHLFRFFNEHIFYILGQSSETYTVLNFYVMIIALNAFYTLYYTYKYLFHMYISYLYTPACDYSEIKLKII